MGVARVAALLLGLGGAVAQDPQECALLATMTNLQGLTPPVWCGTFTSPNGNFELECERSYITKVEEGVVTYRPCAYNADGGTCKADKDVDYKPLPDCPDVPTVDSDTPPQAPPAMPPSTQPATGPAPSTPGPAEPPGMPPYPPPIDPPVWPVGPTPLAPPSAPPTLFWKNLRAVVRLGVRARLAKAAYKYYLDSNSTFLEHFFDFDTLLERLENVNDALEGINSALED